MNLTGNCGRMAMMYFYRITYICDMKTEVTINADILTWAITRAGYELQEIVECREMAER